MATAKEVAKWFEEKVRADGSLGQSAAAMEIARQRARRTETNLSMIANGKKGQANFSTGIALANSGATTSISKSPSSEKN